MVQGHSESLCMYSSSAKCQRSSCKQLLLAAWFPLLSGVPLVLRPNPAILSSRSVPRRLLLPPLAPGFTTVCFQLSGQTPRGGWVRCCGTTEIHKRTHTRTHTCMHLCTQIHTCADRYRGREREQSQAEPLQKSV